MSDLETIPLLAVEHGNFCTNAVTDDDNLKLPIDAKGVSFWLSTFHLEGGVTSHSM